MIAKISPVMQLEHGRAKKDVGGSNLLGLGWTFHRHVGTELRYILRLLVAWMDPARPRLPEYPFDRFARDTGRDAGAASASVPPHAARPR